MHVILRYLRPTIHVLPGFVVALSSLLKSRAALQLENLALRHQMWGAPRIHGELLKLGIEIGETNVGKYMVRRRKPPSPTWRTFLDNLNVTAHPTAEWTAQQLREAFPFDRIPRCLPRDRDGIFGQDFRKQVSRMGIKEVLSAPRSPWQRAFIWSAREPYRAVIVTASPVTDILAIRGIDRVRRTLNASGRLEFVGATIRDKRRRRT